MRRTSRSLAVLVGSLTVTLALTAAPAALSAPVPPDRKADSRSATDDARASAARFPGIRVKRVARGLDIPWDVKPVGRGRWLITERTSKRLLTLHKGRVRRVVYAKSTVWAGGETGLMGLAIDPAFTRNRRFYTCQGGYTGGGGHDVRVMAWTLGRKARRAAFVGPLLTGLPSTSGRHGGCRLLIAANGALHIGTGDAAVGSNPRNLDSLGGKTLRINRLTGAPWPTNPFASSSQRRRFVLTFGHRNIQGLAQRPDGSIWTAEHGPDRDDEINRLAFGGDFGWHPVPGYNESVPMTDHGLPGTQVDARWRSGTPTKAISGITFVRGSRWGAYRGMLAVTALKGSQLMFIRFDSAGRLQSVRIPPKLMRFGRLRSVTQGPGGDLFVTTSNGGGRDSVLRIRPRRR